MDTMPKMMLPVMITPIIGEPYELNFVTMLSFKDLILDGLYYLSVIQQRILNLINLILKFIC